MLRSPYTGSTSQGILLLSSDGSRGLIMVAGMGPLSPSTDYHVWLMRGRDKVRVGRRQEPEYLRPAKDMVLEGSLVSMITPRMVTYAALR